MIGEALLLTLAQIAAALVGFTGLVSALNSERSRQTSDSGTLPEADTRRILFIFFHAVGLMGFAILPVFIFYCFGDGEFIWKTSSGFLAIVLLGLLIKTIQLLMNKIKPRHPKMLKYQYIPTTAVACIVQFFNIYTGLFTMYAVGLMALGAAAVIQFYLAITMVRSRPVAEVPSSPKLLNEINSP